MANGEQRLSTLVAAGPNGTGPRLVVGLDGSAPSTAALRWAVDLARVSGGWVDAVYVYSSQPMMAFAGAGMGAVSGMADIDPADVAADARRIVDEEIAHLPVTDRVWLVGDVITDTNTVQALTERGRGARMLVLGAHRHHLLDGVLGSTARACLRHATCPVVVVPMPDRP
jgi:nucleotide-binding universal stress UspA family protein